MKNVDRFAFFKSYHDALKELSERDRKTMLVAIVDYVFEDKTPDFKGIKKSVWSLIVPHLNVSISKSANAKKKSNENQNEIKSKSNENQTVTTPHSIEREERNRNKKIEIRNRREKEIKKKEKILSLGNCVAPTLADVIDYAKTLGFSDEGYCERFYNHYESVGWVNGAGNKIKNWKLVFNNWVKKDKNKSSETVERKKSHFEEVLDRFMESEDD